MGITLRDYQIDAIRHMKNGCILCGGVGSGKSLTALAYYYTLYGGKVEPKRVSRMANPKPLYIITTARKRDTCEWEKEMCPFLLSTSKECTPYAPVVVDSWNNIKKYESVTDSFFIFDEQRVVGSGTWAKTFVKIAKHNQWILLSATPGDTWSDYIPVFVANGFYKNASEFKREHIVYKRYAKFPQIDRYLNVKRLVRLREAVLVDMDFRRETVSHHETVYCTYDISAYKDLMRYRWNVWKDEPIDNAGELCYALRKLVNSDISRTEQVLAIHRKHPKLIVFYNFDYELNILKGLNYRKGTEIAEWNGHKHQPIPDTEAWIYLVQYTAGAEGWNCIRTDTILFYSQNYSYKVMEQSAGRIDRMNTPYSDLYYYHLASRAPIDIGITRALKQKKKFNERKFVNGNSK